MKKRFGFVSNSSSSSFTCDVCGDDSSGYDMCLSDIDWIRCEHGHTLCCGCQKTHKDPSDYTFMEKKEYCLKHNIIDENSSDWRKENRVKLEAMTEEDEDELDDWFRDDLSDEGHPSDCCPICCFEILDDSDVVSYLYKISGMTNKDLIAQIKDQFNSYQEFKTYLKG